MIRDPGLVFARFAAKPSLTSLLFPYFCCVLLRLVSRVTSFKAANKNVDGQPALQDVGEKLGRDFRNLCAPQSFFFQSLCAHNAGVQSAVHYVYKLTALPGSTYKENLFGTFP
eukprot:2380384-Amphidinium_carterae.1